MNIKRKNLRIIPLFLLGLLYSCSPTVRVTTDYDRDTNFSEYKTFAVYDLKEQEGQVSQLNVDRVTKAIRSEMLSKGFTETTASPDLKINAISILKNKTEVSANTDFYGYGGMYLLDQLDECVAERFERSPGFRIKMPYYNTAKDGK